MITDSGCPDGHTPKTGTKFYHRAIESAEERERGEENMEVKALKIASLVTNQIDREDD